MWTFKSRAAGDVIMLEDLTTRIFSIMGRRLEKRGVLPVEQIPEAIERIEQAVAAEKAEAAAQLAAIDDPAERRQQHDAALDRLGLGQRAWPFLELLRESHAAGKPVTWGL